MKMLDQRRRCQHTASAKMQPALPKMRLETNAKVSRRYCDARRAMNTYIFRPDGDGPFPVVIHYMGFVGVREELSDMCRRLATVGYYVIMPNLYYGQVRCVDLDANRLHDPAYNETASRCFGS